MRTARLAVLLGTLLLVGAFAVGTDTHLSVRADGRSYACDDVITSSMLVSGMSRGPAGPRERRRDDLCRGVERLAGWGVWGGIGVGALALVTGWTVLRDEERARPRPVARLRAAGGPTPIG